MTAPVTDRPARAPVDGLLLLNKPAGITSNQALQKVKRLLKAKKAGHTGSLDLRVPTGRGQDLSGNGQTWGCD
jgi:tRNA pseudouridine55 synthase